MNLFFILSLVVLFFFSGAQFQQASQQYFVGLAKNVVVAGLSTDKTQSKTWFESDFLYGEEKVFSLSCCKTPDLDGYIKSLLEK